MTVDEVVRSGADEVVIFGVNVGLTLSSAGDAGIVRFGGDAGMFLDDDFAGGVIRALSADGVVVNVTALMTVEQVRSVAEALDPATVDDLVQEAWIAALRRRARGKSVGRGWW